MGVTTKISSEKAADLVHFVQKGPLVRVFCHIGLGEDADITWCKVSLVGLDRRILSVKFVF